MNLSKVERYLISNQLKILEVLYPSELEELAVQREAVESGYEFIYGMIMDHLLDGSDMMTIEESKEVWNVMDMFLSIDRSINELNMHNLHDCYTTKFMGYDGNDETKFMGFASYTIERLKRFTHLPLKEDGYLNSHMPVRELYLRMLARWERISYQRRFPMNKDDLVDVLQAAAYPESC